MEGPCSGDAWTVLWSGEQERSMPLLGSKWRQRGPKRSASFLRAMDLGWFPLGQGPVPEWGRKGWAGMREG